MHNNKALETSQLRSMPGSLSNSGRSSPRNHGEDNIAMIVPRGCKIRDEFVCPITRELITDPVIAADGHTYDRSAIEQWIHGCFSGTRGSVDASAVRRTSPKTGQPLEHLHLIPNHNLKRLLKDMIKEGGHALYYREDGSPLNKNIVPNGNSFTDNKQNPASEEAVTASNSDVDAENANENTNSQSIPNTISELNHKLASIDDGPRIALVHAKVLHCRCLGPPESDWNNRSFHLKESSAETLLGGRRRPHEHTAQNFVQFTDATVSRRHFEVRFHDGLFQLRDLGSAGGTFVRIPPRCGVPLKEGMMIMLGKHQLVALGSSASLKEELAVEKQETVPGRIKHNLRRRRSNQISDEMLELSYNQDQSYLGFELIEGFRSRNRNDNLVEDVDEDEEVEAESDDTDDTSLRRNQIQGDENDGEDNSNDSKVEEDHHATNSEHPERDIVQETGHLSLFTPRATPDITSPPSPSLENFTTTTNPSALSANSFFNSGTESQRTLAISPVIRSNKPQHLPPPSNRTNENSDESHLLVLRCFAPEGTPIQNRKYPISREGATLGRKQSNTISFSHPVHKNSHSKNENKDEPSSQQQSFVGIDSSISGEHATIQYNEETESLELFDGVNDRVSTNGTWIRLSPMHEESDWFALDDKSEILIGTVRFQVAVEEVVVEKDLYD